MTKKVSVIFFDLGGVLLTNGWDTRSRMRSIEKFKLDEKDFESRHKEANPALEKGQMTLDEYLSKVIFYQQKSFTPDDYKQFMYSESQVLDGSLEWMRGVASRLPQKLFTLNNESKELHEYRTKTFKLDEIFKVFLTSCYLRQMKPDAEIYASALGAAAVPGDEVLFIDDREKNVKAASAFGIRALQYKGTESLKNFFRENGLAID